MGQEDIARRVDAIPFRINPPRMLEFESEEDEEKEEVRGKTKPPRVK